MSDFITKSLAQIILELQNRNDEKREDIDMLENDVSELEVKNAELQKTIDSKCEDVVILENELLDLQVENAELEEKSQDNYLHIYRLENELSDFQSKNNELHIALGHANMEIKRLTQENGELKEEQELYVKSIDDLEDNRRDMMNTLHGMEENCQTLGYQNVELEESLRKATQQYNECVIRHEQESERFDDRMDACELENEKLETRLENRRLGDREEADYYLEGIEEYIRAYENVHNVGSYSLPVSWYVQKIIMKDLRDIYPDYEFKNHTEYVEIDFDPSSAEL